MDGPKPHDAQTAWELLAGSKTPQGGNASTKGGETTATVVYKLEKALFTVKFDAANSYVVTGKETDDLLKHEKLHLKIAAYVAQKANDNAPKIEETAVVTDKNKEKAIKDAKTQAFAAYKKKFDDYVAKWKEMDMAVTMAYDADTDHSMNAAGQADWDKNWQAKVDKILKDKGW